jgi:hypothetical protein
VLVLRVLHVVSFVALLAGLVGAVVLAFWPSPGKYPWVVPGVVVGAGLLTWWIDRADASALLIIPLVLGALGGPTLGRWLGLDPVTGALIILASLVVPAYLCANLGHAIGADEDWP